MTAPLEMLKAYLAANVRYVTDSDLSAAIAAIEERDAEIAALTRWRKYLDAITFSVLNEQQYPDAVAAVVKMQREIATLTRQLAEMDREASVQRERANGLEYACECAEKQRDAMRGAMSGLIETAADVCRYDLHTPRMMALHAALKEARDVLAERLGQHGRHGTDGDRREVGSGTTDEVPRIDPPVVAGEGCVGGPDGESGCVSLADGAVTLLDAISAMYEACVIGRGPSPMYFRVRCTFVDDVLVAADALRRALGAL